MEKVETIRTVTDCHRCCREDKESSMPDGAICIRFEVACFFSPYRFPGVEWLPGAAEGPPSFRTRWAYTPSILVMGEASSKQNCMLVSQSSISRNVPSSDICWSGFVFHAKRPN